MEMWLNLNNFDTYKYLLKVKIHCVYKGMTRGVRVNPHQFFIQEKKLKALISVLGRLGSNGH